MQRWIPVPDRFWRSTITTQHKPLTRIVFLGMIHLADDEGYVDESPATLADLCSVSVREVKEALKELKAPDPDSKSVDFDGARVINAPDDQDGWMVVNYVKYRSLFTNAAKDKRRDYQRRYMRDYRAKQKECEPNVNLTSSPLGAVNSVSPGEHKGKERKEEERTKRTTTTIVDPPGPTTKGNIKLLNKQTKAVYQIHCAARVRFFESVNGRPPGVLPDLGPKVRKVIRDAIKAHGFEKAWQAGVGIFYSDWHTGRDQATNGRRFLGLPLVWSMNNERDNVEVFAELYHEIGGIGGDLERHVDQILEAAKL